jgi:hypothetical protein
MIAAESVCATVTAPTATPVHRRKNAISRAKKLLTSKVAWPSPRFATRVSGRVDQKQMRRSKEVNAYMQTSDRQSMAQRDSRATYRHITSDALLQELIRAR